MKFVLIVRPEAVRDIVEAAIWYEDQRKGLGEVFENHVWKYISLLPSECLRAESSTHSKFTYIISG